MILGVAARCTGLLKPLFERILQELRTCLIVHADETGWRNNGGRACGWLFANADFAAFLFPVARTSGKRKAGSARSLITKKLISQSVAKTEPLRSPGNGFES